MRGLHVQAKSVWRMHHHVNQNRRFEGAAKQGDRVCLAVEKEAGFGSSRSGQIS